MKKPKLLSIILFSFAILSSGFLNAQNSEIPTKKEGEKKTAWGSGGGNTDRNRSGSGSSTGSGSTGSTPSAVSTPNPYPRSYYPYFLPSEVFSGQGTGTSQGMSTASPKDVAKYNRYRAFQFITAEMGKLVAETQHFVITDPSKTQVLRGNKGFVIEFPPFAFVDAEGNTVTGDVKVNINEYTSFSEFAASGLTCMTTDGEILETGGMINVEAYSGENKLSLANGKAMKITVPDAATDHGFQTFYGTRTDQVMWSTNPNTANLQTDTFPFNGYTIAMLKPAGVVNGEQLNMFLYKGGSSLESYINQNLKVSSAVKDKILKAGIPFVYTIELNAFGKIKSVTPKNGKVDPKSIIAPINNQIIGLLKDAPALSMSEGGLVAGKSYDIVFATTKNYLGTGVAFKTPLEAPATKPNARDVDQLPDEKSVKEFSMSATQMGMINCDRFSGNSSKDTARMHFENADALVYVVIKNMRSMISPTGANGDYFLTKIPENTEVKYIAVIYNDKGEVSMATAEGNFQAGDVKFGTPSKFSAEELKEELEKP